MATYFQSLTGSTVSDTNNIATVSGTYTTSDGGSVPQQPFNFTIEELDPQGRVINSDANIIATSVSNGSFEVSYNSDLFPIPPGYSLEVATTDTSNGGVISTQPLSFPSSETSGVTTGASTANVANGTQTTDFANDAAITVSGGSTVDLSGSAAYTPAGRHLSVAVTLGDGDNKVTLNKGPSTASSTTGNDTIISSGGHDSLYGGFGHDSLVGGGQSHLFGGAAGGDTLVGGLTAASHDTLSSGSGGYDLIKATAGHNVIFGNTNDTIQAGSAHDTIVGGAGPETILGGSNSFIDGTEGPGALTVNLNMSAKSPAGNDTLFGGSGSFHSSDPTVTGSSNVLVHVTQAYTIDPTKDADGSSVVHAGQQTLHVNNVVIDFNGTKTLV